MGLHGQSANYLSGKDVPAGRKRRDTGEFFWLQFPCGWVWRFRRALDVTLSDCFLKPG